MCRIGILFHICRCIIVIVLFASLNLMSVRNTSNVCQERWIVDVVVIVIHIVFLVEGSLRKGQAALLSHMRIYSLVNFVRDLSCENR